MAKQKIGFGGSCHWCTEAIFSSLLGVEKVEQGWISADIQKQTLQPEMDNFSAHNATEYSEAVIVYFDDDKISLDTLVAVHLNSHSCTAEHSMRDKYRSAVYCFDDNQLKYSQRLLQQFQACFDKDIITRVYNFKEFKLNDDKYLNYYYKNPDKAFCQTFINPKLKKIIKQFTSSIDKNKLKHLNS